MANWEEVQRWVSEGKTGTVSHLILFSVFEEFADVIAR